MGWGYYGYGFRPYVSVAQRRANAMREAKKLEKKGRTLAPVAIDGRKIARSPWGLGWCEHLESFSDFSNRLPRGRTYVRNGSVMDLQIKPGRIDALVMGSELYTIRVDVRPLEQDRWLALQQRCAGKIKSVLELLKGGVSAGVMEVMSHRETGMFPAPGEIKMRCSCPDAAHLCKHLAAVLYGIGARLDGQPELLFTLRKVDPAELVAGATEALAAPSPAAAEMDNVQLSDVFGIDLVDGGINGPGDLKADGSVAVPAAKNAAQPSAVKRGRSNKLKADAPKPSRVHGNPKKRRRRPKVAL